MPKIFVLRNRLQEQQARLLETQKGTGDASSGGKHDDDDQTPLIAEQEHPVALIVGRKSDISAPGNLFTLPSRTVRPYRSLPQPGARAIYRPARICSLLCRARISCVRPKIDRANTRNGKRGAACSRPIVPAASPEAREIKLLSRVRVF